MMTSSFKQISPCLFLCKSVAAALGLVAVFGGVLLQVQTQSTAPAQTAPQTQSAKQAAMVHVDITPEHVLNTINPDTATGAWMDDLSKSQVDNLSKPETIQGIKNLGWGSITMRNNSELRLAAWHWNENGTWSDPASKSGYYHRQRRVGRTDSLRLFLFAAASRFHDQRRFPVGRRSSRPIGKAIRTSPAISPAKATPCIRNGL